MAILLFFIFFHDPTTGYSPTHVLFKNHLVFLLSDAPKFRNRGRQKKGVFFFQAAIFPPDLDKNKRKFLFELFDMYIIM